MSKDLSVGFTGIPREPATGVRKVAKNAVDTVRRETSAVAAGAADHPHTATGLLLGVGALAFMAGFAFGRGAADHTSTWR
jgi:hypothetical protein